MYECSDMHATFFRISHQFLPNLFIISSAQVYVRFVYMYSICIHIYMGLLVKLLFTFGVINVTTKMLVQNYKGSSKRNILLDGVYTEMSLMNF